MAFYSRELRVTLLKRTIAANNLAGDKLDQIVLDGLRVMVQAHQQQNAFGTAEIQVYGMTPQQMAFFTRVQDGSVAYSNIIISATVSARLANGLYAQVYSGMVIDAQAQLNQAPDVSFSITCSAGSDQALFLVPPKSYNGSVDAATVFNVLATQAGYSFRNGGVTAVLNSPYFAGTWVDQYKAVQMAANCNSFISNGVLSIWPMGGSLSQQLPLTTVTPQTGLIGYPRRQQATMMCDIEYAPTIVPGGLIELANLNDYAGLEKNCLGKWVIYEILHTMSSEAPGGPWMISLVCYPYTLPTGS